MIHFATAVDISCLLARVRSHADQYSELVLCSPFIDDEVLSRLRGPALHSSDISCNVRIITASRAFDRVTASTKGWQRTRVLGCSHLHAKLYFAIARRDQLTEAIITSANLT